MIDVGQALEQMLFDDNTASQTYELYGPKTYTTAEISEMVDREIFKKRRHVNVPKRILKPIAGIVNKALWWPIMSADEIEREFHDQVIDPNAKTFKDLGIEPADITNFTYHYLVSFVHPSLSRKGMFADSHTAKLSQQRLLRPSSSDREGKEGGQGVYSRALIFFGGLHMEACRLYKSIVEHLASRRNTGRLDWMLWWEL